MEKLAAPWYAGPIRAANRQRTGLTDRQLDAELAQAEAGAEIARMWRVILREASFAMLGGLADRGAKDNSAAKLVAELSGMAAAKTEEAAEDPEADFSAFERAILDNLRAVIRNDGEARKGFTAEGAEDAEKN